METFQKLKILLPKSKSNVFFSDLLNKLENSSWKLRDDLVSNYKKNTFATSKNVLCAESEKYSFNNKNIQGLLWLWDDNGYYEVFNIIPTETRNLEYNFILNKFYNEFIIKLADKYDAKITLSKPEKLKLLLDSK